VRNRPTGTARQDGFTASPTPPGPRSSADRPTRRGARANWTCSGARQYRRLDGDAGTTSPTGQRPAHRANAALQFVVTAWPVEGVQLEHDQGHRSQQSRAERLRDGARSVPRFDRRRRYPAGSRSWRARPFAGGATPSFTGLSSSLRRGPAHYLLASGERSRPPGARSVCGEHRPGTGTPSSRAPKRSFRPVATVSARRRCSRAKHSRVRESRTLGPRDLSYDSIRARSRYTTSPDCGAGFHRPPGERFHVDVRGESPGLPNGMYILVVKHASQSCDSLMILSPAR